MKLSFKTVSDFARSERGKQLVRRAKALDTPENRKKATDTLGRLRGGKPRPPAG
jgi:hypothetical protein